VTNLCPEIPLTVRWGKRGVLQCFAIKGLNYFTKCSKIKTQRGTTVANGSPRFIVI